MVFTGEKGRVIDMAGNQKMANKTWKTDPSREKKKVRKRPTERKDCLGKLRAKSTPENE